MRTALVAPRAIVSLKTARGHMLRAVGHSAGVIHKAHSHTIRVYGWQRGVVVVKRRMAHHQSYSMPSPVSTEIGDHVCEYTIPSQV